MGDSVTIPASPTFELNVEHVEGPELSVWATDVTPRAAHAPKADNDSLAK